MAACGPLVPRPALRQPRGAHPDQPVDSDADEEICAICFEPWLSFQALPCACRLNYCGGCWGRALAASVTAKGRAQCPSCRAFFSVDFNPEADGLVFTQDSESALEAVDWQSRLYSNAKPAQIRRLRQFGEKLNTRCGDALDPTRGPTAKVAPICVCGSELECINVTDRIERMLDETEPSWRSDPEVAARRKKHVEARSYVACDLCQLTVPRSSLVWTCKKGPHAILHPASFDVCERCFLEHSGIPSKEWVSGSELLLSAQDPDDSAAGCSREACRGLGDGANASATAGNPVVDILRRLNRRQRRQRLISSVRGQGRLRLGAWSMISGALGSVR